MLTPAQLQHFTTFGFVVLHQAFSAIEMASISDNFDTVLAEDRRGETFSGEKRQAVLGFIEKRPALTALVEDDRIFEAVEQLLGPGFVWIGSDGNLYVGDTGWHPDGSSLDYGRLKVAFYLDPVTKDSGCLRVIPGSHRPPLHDELSQRNLHGAAAESPYGVAAMDIPSYPLESRPGDVVMFNQNLWHASFGGKAGRRMFTLNFGAAPVTDEHTDILRTTYESNLVQIQRMGYTQSGRVYEDGFLHSSSPRVHGMVAKLVELGFK